MEHRNFRRNSQRDSTALKHFHWIIKIVIISVLTIFIVSGIYLYAKYDPESYRLFPKCPFFLLTGYKCPGCGSQRAFYHLFNGDLTTAFKYNPLIMILLPYIITGIYIEYLTDRTKPHLMHLRHILFGKWAALFLALIIVSYTIIRNLH